MTSAVRAAADPTRRRSRRVALAVAMALVTPAVGLGAAAPAGATGPTYALALFGGTGGAGAPPAPASPPVPPPATTTPLQSPSGVAVDSSGNVYVADTGNNEVDKIDTTGALTVVAGTGTAGLATAGTATSSPLRGPTGVAVDSSGNLYIADAGNNLVEKVTVTSPSAGVTSASALSIVAGLAAGTAGAPLTGLATSSPLRSPSGVVVDSSGNVYIADAGNNQVEKVTGTALSIIVGTGAPNAPLAGTATMSPLHTPSGVALDPSGNLYIADTGNNQIEKVTGSTLSVVAGTGASTVLSGPTGVSVDAAGTVYVADTGHQQVQTVTGSALSVATVTGGSLSSPAGIAVAPSGVVYVADAGAHDVVTLTSNATPTAPHITSPAPKPAANGAAYSTTFTASGFPIPTWSVIGTLPAGLTFNAATGILSGTPTAAGSTTFTVRASNTSSPSAHEDQVVTLVVGAPSAAPTAPKAVGGQLSATLSWTAPASTTTTTPVDPNSVITGYVVTPSIGGVAGTPITLTSTATTATLTKLTPGASYTFTVAAVTGYGAGAKSTATTAVVPYGIPVALPTGQQRFQGADRVSTAVTVSQTLFPNAGSARAVVIASSGSYADALAGARLASADASPLLLTSGSALSAADATEVARVLSPSGTVYVLGGTSAVTDAVMTSLKALATTYTVTRLSGTDRYATAAAIAGQIALDNPAAAADSSPIYLASGTNYPDGLAVSALAARTGGVVLLTNGPTLSAATKAYLTANDPDGSRTVPVGGPAAAAAGPGAAAAAIVGKDRYDTARLVAARYVAANVTGGPAPAAVTTVGLATGTNWPDALVGSAAMGDLGGPLLLTPGDHLAPAASAALTALAAKGAVTTGVVFGGSASVASGTATSFATLLSPGQ